MGYKMNMKKGLLFDYIIPTITALLTLSAFFLLSPLNLSGSCITPSGYTVITDNTSLCADNYTNVWFSFGASDVTLDCNASNISFTNSDYTVLFDLDGYNNTAITNCNITTANQAPIFELTNTNNLSLENISTAVDYQDSNSAHVYVSNVLNLSINNFNMSNPSGYARHGMQIFYTNLTTINNTRMECSAQDGAVQYVIGIEYRHSNNLTIDQLTISNEENDGIIISNSSDISISRATITGADSSGISTTISSNITILDSTISGSRGANILFSENVSNVNLTGNNVSSSQNSRGIQLQNNCSNIFISLSNISSNNESGIRVESNSSNITIDSNYFSNNLESAVEIGSEPNEDGSYNGTDPNHNISIINNIMFENGVESIYTYNVDILRVGNNTFVPSGPFSSIASVSRVNNTEIYNNKILFIALGSGLTLEHAVNVSIHHNEVNNTFGGLVFNLLNVSNANISHNVITNLSMALPGYISGTTPEQYNLTMENNTVNGLPIVYNFGTQNTVVNTPQNVSMLVYAGCSNVTIQNQNLVEHGIFLLNCSDSEISGNNLKTIAAVSKSTNCKITDNVFTGTPVSLNLSTLGLPTEMNLIGPINVSISAIVVNNTILGSAASLESQGTEISDNQLSGAAVAISSNNTRIENNVLNANRSVFLFANTSLNTSTFGEIGGFNLSEMGEIIINLSVSASANTGAIGSVFSNYTTINGNNIPSVVVSYESQHTTLTNNNLSMAVFFESPDGLVENNTMNRTGIELLAMADGNGTLNLSSLVDGLNINTNLSLTIDLLSGGFFGWGANRTIVRNNNLSNFIIFTGGESPTISNNRIVTNNYINLSVLLSALNLSMGPVGLDKANISLDFYLNPGMIVASDLTGATITNNDIPSYILLIGGENSTITNNKMSSIFFMDANNTKIENNDMTRKGVDLRLALGFENLTIITTNSNYESFTFTSGIDIYPLSNSSVTSITSVSGQYGGLWTSFNESVDFNLVNDSIDWSPIGRDPDNGASFSVDYEYTTGGYAIPMTTDFSFDPLAGGAVGIDSSNLSFQNNNLTAYIVLYGSDYPIINNNKINSNSSLNLSVSVPNISALITGLVGGAAAFNRVFFDFGLYFNMGAIAVADLEAPRITNNDLTSYVVVFDSNSSVIENNTMSTAVVLMSNTTSIKNNDLTLSGFDLSIGLGADANVNMSNFIGSAVSFSNVSIPLRLSIDPLAGGVIIYDVKDVDITNNKMSSFAAVVQTENVNIENNNINSTKNITFGLGMRALPNASLFHLDLNMTWNLGGIVVIGSFDGMGVPVNVQNNTLSSGILLVGVNETNVKNNRANASIIVALSRTDDIGNLTGYANITNNVIDKNGFNISFNTGFDDLQFDIPTIANLVLGLIGGIDEELVLQEDNIQFLPGTDLYNLSNTPVISISEVTGIYGSYNYTFSEGSDYVLNNNSIDWSPSGSDPDNMTSFRVAYSANLTFNASFMADLNFSIKNILSTGVIAGGIKDVYVTDNTASAPIIVAYTNKSIIENNHINAGKDLSMRFQLLSSNVSSVALPFTLNTSLDLDFGGIISVLSTDMHVRNNLLSAGIIAVNIDDNTTMDISNNDMSASMFFYAPNATIVNNTVRQGGAEFSFSVIINGLSTSLIDTFGGLNLSDTTNASMNMSFIFENPLTASIAGYAKLLNLSNNNVSDTVFFGGCENSTIRDNVVARGSLFDLRLAVANSPTELVPIYVGAMAHVDSGSLVPIYVKNTTIENNTMGASLIGIGILNDTKIRNNTVNGGVMGLLMSDSEISNNTIRNGTFALGLNISYNNTNISDVIEAGTIFTLIADNNTITNNNISGGFAGIFSILSKSNFSNNFITDARFGVISALGGEQRFINNTINASAGFYINKDYDLTIENNTIYFSNVADSIFPALTYLKNLTGNLTQEIIPSGLDVISPTGILLLHSNANVLNNTVKGFDYGISTYNDKYVVFFNLTIPIPIFGSISYLIVAGGWNGTIIENNTVSYSKKMAITAYNMTYNTLIEHNKLCYNNKTFNVSLMNSYTLKNNTFCISILTPISRGTEASDHGSLPWVNFTFNISNILQTVNRTACELLLYNCSIIPDYPYNAIYTSDPICTNYSLDVVNDSMAENININYNKTLEPANYTWTINCSDNQPSLANNTASTGKMSLIVSEYDLELTASGPATADNGTSITFDLNLKNKGIKDVDNVTLYAAVWDPNAVWDPIFEKWQMKHNLTYNLPINASLRDSLPFEIPSNASGSILFGFYLDPEHKVIEFNEGNNAVNKTVKVARVTIQPPGCVPIGPCGCYPCPTPTPTPTATPTPTPVPETGVVTNKVLSSKEPVPGIPGLFLTRTMTITTSTTTMSLYFSNENTTNLGKMRITENILKDFASDASKPKFSPAPTIVNADPIVQWYVPGIKAGRGVYFSYAVDYMVGEDIFSRFKVSNVTLIAEVTATPAPVQQVSIETQINQTTNLSQRAMYTMTGIAPPSSACGICDISAEKNCSCSALWVQWGCGLAWTVLLLLAAISAFIVTKLSSSPVYIISAALVSFIIAFTTHACMGITFAVIEVITVGALRLLKRR